MRVPAIGRTRERGFRSAACDLSDAPQGLFQPDLSASFLVVRSFAMQLRQTWEEALLG